MADTRKPDQPLGLEPLHAPERRNPFAPVAEPVGEAHAHRGPERRKGGERRKGNDRREEFRFEPGKNDRRSGKDRRKRSRLDDTLIR